MTAQNRPALETAMMEYFRAPDAAAVAALFADTPVDEHWRAETVLILPVFLALMLDRDPRPAAGLVERVRGDEAPKVEVLAQALNYSHLPERRRLMERLLGEAAAGGMDEDGADFLEFEIGHPVHVDMLWAAFFATGDQAYVHRIAGLTGGFMPAPALKAMTAMARETPELQPRVIAAVLANAALRSLSLNVRDYPEVKAAVAAFAASGEGEAHSIAAAMVAGAGGG